MREKARKNRCRTPAKGSYETSYDGSSGVTSEVWEMLSCRSETQKIGRNNGKYCEWIKTLSWTFSEKYQSRKNRKQRLKFQEKKHDTKRTIMHMSHRPSKSISSDKTGEKRNPKQCSPGFWREFWKSKMFHADNRQNHKSNTMLHSNNRER